MKAACVPFAAGCLGGILFVASLVLLNVGGLGTLIARDQAILLPLSILLAQFGGLFGLAVAVTSVASGDRGGGRLNPSLAALPLRSRSR